MKNLAYFGNDVNHEKFAVNLKNLYASRLPTHQVRHICKAHKADTQKPTLQKSLPCANGYDGDGTEGCKHIKAKGGKTFTQDMSAEVEHMPLSAQATGCVDFVMPLNKIPGKLKSLAAVLKT